MLLNGETITGDNRGPIVNIVTWVLFVCAAITVILRLNNKLRKGRGLPNWKNLGIDDFTIGVALLLSLVQCALISQQVSSGGLGKRWSVLSGAQIVLYQKYAYAAEIIYIFTLWVAKGSCLFFYRTLARERYHSIFIWATMAFLSVWAVASILTVALQCAGTPTPWRIVLAKCCDMTLAWSIIESIDVVIEIALIIEAMILLRELQVEWTKKIAVLLAFAMRLVLIPLIILRIYFIREAHTAQDRSIADAKVALVTEAYVHATLIVTCTLFLRPLMEQLQMGWTVSNVNTGAGYNGIVSPKPGVGSANGSGVLRVASRRFSGSQAGTLSTTRTNDTNHSHSTSEARRTSSKHQRVREGAEMLFPRESSANSQCTAIPHTDSSGTGRPSLESIQMAIKQTISYKVESEASSRQNEPV